jgi:hypothetical protein
MEPLYAKRSGVPSNRCSIPNHFAPAEFRNLQSVFISKKKEVGIDIRDHFASKRYRPGSVVEGTVTFNTREQLQSGGVSIKLVCDSSLETYHHSVLLETWHRLLDLDMPISHDALPESGILQPGHAYTIPFYFVLPASLDTEACTHNVHSGAMKLLHSQLPPSILGWERQVLVPRGVCLEYGIIAQILDTNTPQYAKLASKQTFQFLPYLDQHPPLYIPITNQTYQLRSSKKLRKNVFSKGTANVTLSADQPEAFTFDTSGRELHSMFVQTDLYFESFDDRQILPQICTASADLKMETWSQDEPLQDWPHLADRKDSYSSMETIAKKAEINLAWKSDTSNQGSIAGHQSCNTYRSIVKIPLHFTNEERLILPSFYSCLLARTYQLRINVSVATVALKLVLPIQIAIGPSKETGIHARLATEVHDYHDAEYPSS